MNFAQAGIDTDAMPIFFFIAVMFVVAVRDIQTRTVKLVWTVMVGIAAIVVVTLQAGSGPMQWLSGGLSALAAFGFYLFLGMRGVMGGGDVKLAPFPALVLGAMSPLLGVWWIVASLAIQQIVTLFVRLWRRIRSQPAKRALELPHVPAMWVALVVGSWLFSLAAG